MVEIKKLNMASKSDGMEGVKIDRVLIGAGCNRIVNNVSWGACDLVSFGAQNAVAIFCPKVLFFCSSSLVLFTSFKNFFYLIFPV